MSQTPNTDKSAYRLTFDGRMTAEFSQELEDRIINALRRHSYLEVDLSGVSEIDLCGIHLLGVLQGVGGKNVVIVATSPIVERASRRFFAFSRGANLARAARK